MLCRFLTKLSHIWGTTEVSNIHKWWHCNNGDGRLLMSAVWRKLSCPLSNWTVQGSDLIYGLSNLHLWVYFFSDTPKCFSILLGHYVSTHILNIDTMWIIDFFSWSFRKTSGWRLILKIEPPSNSWVYCLVMGTNKKLTEFPWRWSC